MAESRGTLEITVLTADGGVLEGATVILTGISRGSMTEISNGEGFATFSVPTGAVANSLTPNPRERPYVTVDIRIVLRGFITVSIIGEQIFPEGVHLHFRYDGTVAEWEAIEKHEAWANGNVLIIDCTDGQVQIGQP